MKNLIKLQVFLLVFGSFFIPFSTKAASFHSGKIYLQVEKNGEAWYVYPVNDYRYYLGRPNDAFNIMRSLGLGISDSNLKQIPVGILPFTAYDYDKDGLPDDLEKALGTKIDNPDSDGDDYSDKTEIENWFDPNGKDKLPVNKTLINQLRGRILLQVEKNGEAWYLNPADDKRYYLGRPADAFEIMRKLGIGITNANLAKIYEDYIGVNADVQDHYKIKYPDSWATSVETEKQKINSKDVIHHLHAEERSGAAILDVYVYQSDSKPFALSDFTVSSSSYDPKRTDENFVFDIKPARKQTLKYDTIADFKTITYYKGKRIYVAIMVNPKKVIELKYSIPYEEEIPNYEKIFNRIMDDLKITY